MKAKIYSFIILISLVEIYAQQLDWIWKNPYPQGNGLNSVFVINSNTMIAVGECGVIIRTTNSGVNWNLIQYEDTTKFNSVYFINDQTGWIAGGMYASPL